MMKSREIPSYILRILCFWYSNLHFKISWCNLYSVHFNVSNGVRQGGVLSPLLFNIYVMLISDELNKLKIRCVVGHEFLNHIFYADDYIIIPYKIRITETNKRLR